MSGMVGGNDPHTNNSYTLDDFRTQDPILHLHLIDYNESTDSLILFHNNTAETVLQLVLIKSHV
jgi:hypothetical protein